VVEGVDAWGNYNVTGFWRLSVGWVELRNSLHAAFGTAPNSISDLGNDPARHWHCAPS
jgi:hypothetical protein